MDYKEVLKRCFMVILVLLKGIMLFFLGVTCSSLSSINFARASLQKSSKYEKIGVERFLQRSLYYWLIQKS